MAMQDDVAALRRMTVSQLRQRYAEVFGEPTRSGHRDHLIKRIAWRLQSREQGSLTERARRRAAELAHDADLRLHPPRRPTAGAGGPPGPPATTAAPPLPPDSRLPPPGSLITRAYKGRTLCVTVLERGFEYDGAVYRSLSAVAKAITGSHLNGFAFFNLAPRKSRRAAQVVKTAKPPEATDG